jgi:V/A-type H+-transporting ATPase subunit C
MGKSAEFMEGALLDGGEISADSVLSVARAGGSGLAELYAPTVLKAAAEAGAEALTGDALTEFEKRCDDAVSAYLAGAQLVPFGEAPLVGYLAARETEYTNLRIILMGRKAGLPAEIIRSRLRASYV